MTDLELIIKTAQKLKMTRKDRATVAEQLQLVGCYLAGELMSEDEVKLAPIFDDTIAFMNELCYLIMDTDKKAIA